MNTLYLCGAGNSEGVRLALTVNKAQRLWDRIVLLDDDPQKHGGSLLGVPILGSLALLANAGPGSAAINLVARTTLRRASVHRCIAASGVPFATLVHPDVDAQDCVLGQGVLVYTQAVLSPETRLGDGVVVFMRAVVGHGAAVGAGSVLAAGSVLNARVTLAEGVYVGSNASVLPDVRIGAGATVGANTLVATDVPAAATIVGVPGVILHHDPVPDVPSPQVATAQADAPASRPQVDLEARLLGLLHGVLGETRATATDRFFDAGGSSLKAIQLLAEIRTTLGQEVPLTVLYARCTMRELAQHMLGLLSTSDAAQAARARALLRRQGAPASARLSPLA